MKKLKTAWQNFAADFANVLGGAIAQLLWLPKIHYQQGAEHVRRPDGGTIFVLNHTWWFDAAILCILCLRRRIHAVVAMDVAEKGHATGGLHSLRCICVDRRKPDLSFLHEALGILRTGGCVAIFTHSTPIRSMAAVTRSYSWATLSPPSGWARPMSVIQMWWLSG